MKINQEKKMLNRSAMESDEFLRLIKARNEKNSDVPFYTFLKNVEKMEEYPTSTVEESPAEMTPRPIVTGQVEIRNEIAMVNSEPAILSLINTVGDGYENVITNENHIDENLINTSHNQIKLTHQKRRKRKFRMMQKRLMKNLKFRLPLEMQQDAEISLCRTDEMKEAIKIVKELCEEVEKDGILLFVIKHCCKTMAGEINELAIMHFDEIVEELGLSNTNIVRLGRSEGKKTDKENYTDLNKR